MQFLPSTQWFSLSNYVHVSFLYNRYDKVMKTSDFWIDRYESICAHLIITGHTIFAIFIVALSSSRKRDEWVTDSMWEKMVTLIVIYGLHMPCVTWHKICTMITTCSCAHSAPMSLFICTLFNNRGSETKIVRHLGPHTIIYICCILFLFCTCCKSWDICDI